METYLKKLSLLFNSSLLDEDLDLMVSEESKARNELTNEIDVLEQGARILAGSFDAVEMSSEAVTLEAYSIALPSAWVQMNLSFFACSSMLSHLPCRHSACFHQSASLYRVAARYTNGVVSECLCPTMLLRPSTICSAEGDHRTVPTRFRRCFP